ncbi:hypothetical protein ElyMa_000895200 [Elysia marginata]|uniref:Tetraspanin n=1 Tax=Elysia marginata TaxID=1093978 RepID=A0AAV4H7A0_9GAST|nr:hypothetical protein ElyMa_000895200 [Elysia marginata]
MKESLINFVSRHWQSNKTIYFVRNCSIHFQYPPACCNSYVFNEGTEDRAFKSVVWCAKGLDESQIKWMGCLQRLEGLVKDHEVFIITVLTVMFSIEGLALVMAIYLSLIEKKRYADLQEQ